MSALQGRVAVVTGAARGLGAAFVGALRAAGATVIGCDVLPGAEVVADVSQPDQVRRFVEGVVGEHGRIDVAVANAGICRITSPLDPWDKALDDFEALMGVNTRGVYLLGRAVAPVMAAQGGGDIVVVSTDHVAPPPGRPTGGGAAMDVYDASKWALRGLVEAWARALARHGVRVNALCMGATDTDMIRSFVGDRLTPEMEASWMRPEQIAELLVALVGEGPEGRTGQHIGIWVGHPVALPPVEALATRSSRDLAGLG